MPADNATLLPTDKFIKPEAKPSILKQTSVHIYIFFLGGGGVTARSGPEPPHSRGF